MNFQPKLWINGKWVASQGKLRKIENPATTELIAEIPDATESEVAQACEAAKVAFADGRWSEQLPGQRSLAIWRFADLLEKHANEFAKLESQNTGKPYPALSLDGDLAFSVDNLRFFATVARDNHGMHAGEFQSGYTSMFRREPVGPVGQIAPWNYPVLMAVWKLGPALAAGCTIVFKPAPTTPLTALMLAELSKEAGIPDGVINIVTGGNETGQAIVENPHLRMISVTGSTATGKKVMQLSSVNLKRVHLELGGKAPVLVLEDADISVMAEKVTIGATTNTGQDCTAATRIYVDRKLIKQAEEAVVEAMRSVKVGDPFVADTAMGPFISSAQRDRAHSFVEKGKTEGARLLTGGKPMTVAGKGYFYEPTVFTNVEQKSEIVQQEIFGPVITIQEFSQDSEAVALGNDVAYGLAASIFSKDVQRALKTARQLEFGTVWINDHLPLASESPHGGFKQSGFGKDLSSEAMGDYLVTKHVMLPS